MLRSVSLLALAVSLGLASPVQAADWQWDDAEMREPLGLEPKDWTDLGDNSDTLGFEFGMRYWYSMGANSFSSASGTETFESTDKTHFGEAHLRIEDDSTQTWATGKFGYSFATDGDFNNDGTTGSFNNGTLSYYGADIGYNMLDDGQAKFGPMVGYQQWNDQLNTGRRNFAVASGNVPSDPLTGDPIVGGDSKTNNLTVHALRLGLQTKAEFGNFIDVTAELAAIPYASIAGTLGSAGTPLVDFGTTLRVQSSAMELSGWGYGAMGELMMGFRPAENVVFRLGGRAWYLQGTADTAYDTVTIADAIDNNADGDFNDPGDTPAQVVGQQRYISQGNPFSQFRYGLLAELTYKF
jgi:hypothetical protein